MMWPLAPFIAFMARRKAKKALEAAERQRAALASQIAYRAKKHAPRAYLVGDLRKATEASLRATVAGRA